MFFITENDTAGAPLPPPLDLHSLVSLSTLTIDCGYPTPQALPWVCCCLQSIPHVNCIEEVRLVFGDTDLYHASWRAIDSAIASLTSPRLRAVSLQMSVSNEDFQTFFRDQIPSLVKTQRLSVINGSARVDPYSDHHPSTASSP